MPTIEISHEAMEFLKSRAQPLVDTTISVVDKLIAEHCAMAASEKSVTPEHGLTFSLKTAPSLKYTVVTDARIAGKPATQNYWNSILEDVISACVAKGVAPDNIRSKMSAQIKDGLHHDSGYRPVASAGFSFQGLEANRVFKNIAILAEEFMIQIELHIRWQKEPKAAFPDERGVIVFP